LKQLGIAYTSYEQDYDEMAPAGKSFATGIGWAGQIYPYVRSTQTYICPNDSGPNDLISYAVNSNLVGYTAAPRNPIPTNIAQMTSPSRSVLLFELVNCNASIAAWSIPTDAGSSPAGNGLDATSGNSLSGANSGSGAPHVSCATCIKYATGVMANVCPGNSCAAPAITATTSYYTSVDGTHSGGANFLLADNHAKWFIPSQVAAGADVIVSGFNNYATCPANKNNYAPTVDCSNPKQYAATFAIR
jgi:prepilin-type processing-associated H-X9-DG protein